MAESLSTGEQYGSQGNRLLDEYLAKNNIRNTEAASELGLTKSAVAHLRRQASPRAILREAIEKYTHGHVPAAAWKTERDLAFVAQVTPFDPARRSARAARSIRPGKAA